MKKARVSIVVPIYNVEKYLKECLDSLVNQTYKRIEILLIDDGSKDFSPHICDEYEKMDNRIQVFHIENAGVSNARNLGIQHATGEWIMFLDSDDYLEENAIEKMLEVAERKNVDVVGSFYYRTYINTEVCNEKISNSPYEVNNDSKSLIREMIFFPEQITELYPTCLVPWGKIIKTSIIKDNNISYFTNMTLHEDATFNMILFSYVKNHAICPEPLIHYRQRKNSLSQNSTKDNFDSNCKFCQVIEKLVCDNTLNIDVSENDYYTFYSKYYAYGMMNLWLYSKRNLKVMKRQLLNYRENSPFKEALDKVDLDSIKNYNYTERLNMVIKYSSLKKYRMLMLICIAAYSRLKLREVLPIGNKKLFD